MTDASALPAPDAPLVRIDIVGSTVIVDDAVIDHDGTRSLHQVAVEAAAERVAGPYGGPVRAVAVDDEGSARMVIHPDGTASDVELIDDAEVIGALAIAASGTGSVAAAGAAATTALPSAGAGAAAMAGFLAPSPATAPPPMRDGVTRANVLRTVAVIAALALFVGAGVLLLGLRDTGGSQARGTTDGTAAPPQSAEQAVAAQTPVVEVRVTPGSEAVRLSITTDTLPSTAGVSITLSDARVVTQSVALEEATTDVELAGLTAGPASWQVEVPDAPLQTGQTTVQAAFVAPSPTPTSVPVVPPTAGTPTQAPTHTGAGSGSTAGATKAGTRKAGTKKAGTRKAGARKAGTRKAGTRKAGTARSGRPSGRSSQGRSGFKPRSGFDEDRTQPQR